MAWQPGGRPGVPFLGPHHCGVQTPGVLPDEGERSAWGGGRGMLDPPAAAAPPKPSPGLRKSAWPAGAPGGHSSREGTESWRKAFLIPAGPRGAAAHLAGSLEKHRVPQGGDS